ACRPGDTETPRRPGRGAAAALARGLRAPHPRGLRRDREGGEDRGEHRVSVIDVHPHVISTDAARWPRDPLGGSQSDWSRDRPVSAERMVAAMDEAGVSRSALVQAATCYGYDNGYLADAVARFPGRFAGVFSVDVFRPDAAERIGHWMDKGLHGLRIFIAGHTMASKDARLDDPRADPVWALAS